MTDKHLDDAIDRAVREMTSGEPAGDLRQRVLDDITRPAPWTLGWRALAYGAAALAAIVLLVVNLVVRRPDTSDRRVASSPGAAVSSPAPVRPAPQQPG